MQIESSETKSLVRLDRIADEINNKFGEAVRFASDSVRSGHAAVVAAIECGKLLAKAKDITGHGKWEKWLADFCADIHANTARKWMLLAKAHHGVDLESCRGIRQAYIACGIIPDPANEAKKPKALGTADVDLFAEFVGQINKECDRICSLMEDFELDTMPEPRKVEIRAAIERVKALEERL